MYLIYKSTRIEELETFDSKGSLSQKSLTKSFKRKRTVDIDTDVLKMELKYMRDVLKALESKKLDEYLPKIEEQNDFFKRQEISDTYLTIFDKNIIILEK